MMFLVIFFIMQSLFSLVFFFLYSQYYFAIGIPFHQVFPLYITKY